MAPNDVPESVEELTQNEWTPKQLENWKNHGKPTVEKLETPKSIKWYLRTYRPKKRGDGMMERNHVKIGTPEHYFKKKVGGLKRPMGSIQGEIMASMGVPKDLQKEIDEAALEYVFQTTNKIEKRRILEQSQRLANVLGL